MRLNADSYFTQQESDIIHVQNCHLKGQYRHDQQAMESECYF